MNMTFDGCVERVRVGKILCSAGISNSGLRVLITDIKMNKKCVQSLAQAAKNMLQSKYEKQQTRTE